MSALNTTVNSGGILRSTTTSAFTVTLTINSGGILRSNNLSFHCYRESYYF
jgi:hypothetical protein